MRPKSTVFLTFLGLGLVPLLLLAAINYWGALRLADATLQRNQEQDIEHFDSEISRFLALNRTELTRFSRAKPLVQYLESLNQETDGTSESASPPANPEIIPSELQVLFLSALKVRTKIATISVFRNNDGPLFVAELREHETYQPVDFRTKYFPASQPKPDARVWSTAQPDLMSSPVSSGSVGPHLYFTMPVFNSQKPNSLVGALVAEVRLNRVFAEAAQADKSLAPNPPHMFIVLNRSGEILYHTNEAVGDHSLEASMPHLMSITSQMLSTERGRASFVAGSNGPKYSTSYARLPPLDVIVVRASNQAEAFTDAHRSGRRGLLIATILGIAAGALWYFYWNKKARGIRRVSEGVEAIAQGKLDHQIDLRSRDDLRPLADNLEVMKKQLRDQLAREAETQQFQSFVRLSAILTHDLKNAIGALSLTVSNMERHSENAEFRVDAMKTLRNATDDLRALVARLSNPVSTLSGEHKLPRVVDLVSVLRRVISKTTGGGPQEIKLELPKCLFALVDVERIDTVIENLLVNASEAMAGKQGTVTVAAGLNAEGKPFFSVGDEGEGMSRSFIQEHLFRPFATTKRRGVGLGLYTCREVIRANGGTIEVSSKTGVGTTFLVVLPSPPTDESRENVLRAHQ